MQKLENEGIITKVDWSDWATPGVAVSKANGLIRVCGDFKVSINPELKVGQYPLPGIEYIFANLAAGHQDRTAPCILTTRNVKKYLTINMHKGLYLYNRLLFGVASAAAIWQRTIDQILQNIPGTQVILDDTIITGNTYQVH